MHVACDYFFHQYIRVSAKSNSGLELESLIQIESIYKLEIINLIRSGNWSTNSCNRSTNFLQVLAVTKALLWAARWPRWRRFDQSPGKYCTIKKIPCQVRAQLCGLDLHLNSSLLCWAGSKAGCRAAGYPGPCSLLSAASPYAGYDAAALQTASPSQSRAMGKPSSSLWSCLFFGLWDTWREPPVLPPPPARLQRYLLLLHSSTLGNANALPSLVAEKWAIKKNTWENRRDSTEDQGTFYFFFPRLT